MKIDNALVGKAIARFRELRGLTQAELNELVGLSTIQHIEQGRNAVSLDCLNRIATALDIPAACILLLGSKVSADDKLLESLQTLTRTALDSVQPKTAVKTPPRRSQRRTRKAAKMGSSGRKKVTKRESVST